MPSLALLAVLLVGADEPAPVGAMGRAPDASVQPTSDVKLLQWRWQRAYAIPDRMLGYTCAGGTYRPIPHTDEGMVRDACALPLRRQRLLGSGDPTRDALSLRWGRATQGGVNAAGVARHDLPVQKRMT